MKDDWQREGRNDVKTLNVKMTVKYSDKAISRLHFYRDG